MPTTNIPTEPENAEHSASAAAENPPTPVVVSTKDCTIDEGKAEASRDAGDVQKRMSDTGITEEGTAATSGVPQPAAAESTEDRRSSKRDREWDNAALPGRGPRNALTYNVAEGILKDMRRWYEERLDGEDVSVAWKHLHQCLFKTVTVPLSDDRWRNPNLGAAQPEDESEGQAMVVSKEHVAHQVREVIERREKWLALVNLPMDTIMSYDDKEACLKASKREYHSRSDQLALQTRDAADNRKQ
jgi:hypothetical protein